jgi:hypothetical protein
MDRVAYDGVLLDILNNSDIGDSRYTRFRISAVLFQYHEEHQYLISDVEAVTQAH